VTEPRRFPPPWSAEETDACFIPRSQRAGARISTSGVVIRGCPTYRKVFLLDTNLSSATQSRNEPLAASMATLPADLLGS
jgi:hypothetical protein